jgi:predicted  nucleic acid-binding Zn-ribbon protein
MDLALRRLQAEADEKPAMIAHEKVLLDQAKARLAMAETAAKEAQKAADRKELDLRTKEAEGLKYEGQLNGATSNKVYSDLLLAIGSVKADIGRMEEGILVAMDLFEEREAEVEKVRAEVRVIEGEYKEAEKRLAAQAAELQEKVDHKKRLRDALAREIDANVLAVYDRVRAIRKGVGMAEVETDGETHYCTACQMEVNLQDVSMAIRGEKIIQCRSCQRVLFIESAPTLREP